MPLKTKPQARRYIRKIADLMGMKDWEVKLQETASEEGLSGSVQPIEGRKVAIMWLGVSFWLEAAEGQRNTICHELLHCHHAAADIIAITAMHHEVEPQWRLAMEYGIDGVATAWARMLPLP